MDRRKICEYMELYGIKYSNKGFKYLVEAVEMVMELPDDDFKVTWLYNTIAEKHGTTPGAVERAIRNEMERNKLNMHNKEFIARAVYVLRG